MIYLFYQSMILRMAAAAVASFLIVIFLGRPMIRFLIRQKLGDRPEFYHSDLNQLTRDKSDIPTMGGILIIIAIFASVLIFADLGNYYIRMAMVALVWLGGVGAADDWIKLRRASGKGSRDGLRTWEKLLFQIGLAVLLSIFIQSYGRNVETTRCFYLPFKADPIYLPMLGHIIITALTIVGASNAVNLTDGMDGLAAGCLVIVSGFLLIIAWLVGVEQWASAFHLPLVARAEEMTILCASVLGSCLGFLWYNAPPAYVFMGDTGSLPLGGLIGYVAIVTRQELLLLIAGGVFVMEAGSVLLQVSFFKLTKPGAGMPGRRIFRVAPIHHHFHLGGWAEPKVVVRFWILSVIFAGLALAMLKLR